MACDPQRAEVKEPRQRWPRIWRGSLRPPIFALAELGRIEKAPLDRAPDPMHRALADLAGLSARLELGRDLLQKCGRKR